MYKRLCLHVFIYILLLLLLFLKITYLAALGLTVARRIFHYSTQTLELQHMGSGVCRLSSCAAGA